MFCERVLNLFQWTFFDDLTTGLSLDSQRFFLALGDRILVNPSSSIKDCLLVSKLCSLQSIREKKMSHNLETI